MIRHIHYYDPANRTGVWVDTDTGDIRSELRMRLGEIVLVGKDKTPAVVITCGRDFAFESKDLRDIADAMDGLAS